MSENIEHTNSNTDTSTEQSTVDVTAEATCILQGVFTGAAVVLVIQGKNEDTEAATVRYLTQYTSALIAQGITRDALGFLWSQMGTAAEADPSNTVQQVSHYLFGLVLEELSTVGKQS